MGNLFTTVLYQPLFNLLIFLYNLIPDIGVAIIIVTVVVRIVIWPLSHKGLKSQKALQTLQPKLEALKEKYKDNKEKLAQETMALYKREKINPAASCLPLLIQLPIIWAVFRVFRNGLTENNFDLLYSFVKNPGTINPLMLGFIDLSQPQIVLAFLAGAAQFWHSRILMKKKGPQPVGKELSFAETMSKQMMYMMPVFTILIASNLPGGLALYWLIITLVGVLDQQIINKAMDKPDDFIPPPPSAPSQPEVIDVK